ncbi:class I SAM-dependent methyltransferase [Actinoplanes sp. NBRC 103695]|uniref:O-methyltransferase n=1 Tax=Actinoplanes sp. NBRC 103695 TaxID=3032202 RepID=UPI0024A249AD|nr:class I SAM-dependent methyltransferase [Actinoplanes sp. NBRC 103695]GLY97593.1 hypothetical protein Acsp02_48470 [Actinoplanes sp. NBRC 103695]
MYESEELWRDVDRYFVDTLVGEDDALVAARAGVAGWVEVVVGPAAASARRLAEGGADAYDFVFIDADKPSNPAYLEASLRLSRPGTVIVIDNVVRNGAVADPDSTDERVRGVRAVHDMIAADPRLEATALQTVGSKGWDGFTLIRVGG